MTKHLFACVAAAAMAVAGCAGFDHKTSATSPSSTPGIEALTGNWQSVQDAGGIIPNPSTCIDFKWSAATQTATSAAGSFSATCNGILFSGFANGTLTGTTVAWGANGTATAASLPQSPCPITLTGTAELGTNSIRVPYTGGTCMGPVSGVQILNRK